MAKINLEEFKKRVLHSSIEELVSESLVDDDPWLFRADASKYIELQAFLSAQLEDPHSRCIVVGSAKYGFSISPDTFGRKFRAQSDIDVAVISPHIFDEIWDCMLGWRYPWHTRNWADRERDFGVAHMEDHIAGFVTPDQIKVYIGGAKRVPPPVQRRSVQWFDTFKMAANIGPARGHDVEGRLYRSIDHLKLYTRWGLDTVKKNLT